MQISDHSPARLTLSLPARGVRQELVSEASSPDSGGDPQAGRGGFLGGRYRLPCVPRGGGLLAVVQILPDGRRAVMGFAFTGNSSPFGCPVSHRNGRGDHRGAFTPPDEGQISGRRRRLGRLAPTVAGADLRKDERHPTSSRGSRAADRGRAGRAFSDDARAQDGSRQDAPDHRRVAHETPRHCRLSRPHHRDGVPGDLEIQARRPFRALRTALAHPETYHEVAAPGGGGSTQRRLSSSLAPVRPTPAAPLH